MRWESFVWEDARFSHPERKRRKCKKKRRVLFQSYQLWCELESLEHSTFQSYYAVEEHRMIHTRHIPKLRPVEWLRNNFILHILKLQSRLGTPQLSCRKGTSVHLNNEADTENIIHVRRQVIAYTCTDSIHLNSNTGTEKTWSYWHSRL